MATPAACDQCQTLPPFALVSFLTPPSSVYLCLACLYEGVSATIQAINDMPDEVTSEGTPPAGEPKGTVPEGDESSPAPSGEVSTPGDVGTPAETEDGVPPSPKSANGKGAKKPQAQQSEQPPAAATADG